MIHGLEERHAHQTRLPVAVAVLQIADGVDAEDIGFRKVRGQRVEVQEVEDLFRLGADFGRGGEKGEGQVGAGRVGEGKVGNDEGDGAGGTTLSEDTGG